MMKKVLFMVSSLNIGGVEKSLVSLLSAIPKDKYEITVITLEKMGDFLGYIPQWVNVEEASWFETIKPIIMQSPQQTIKQYFTKKEYMKILRFAVAYLLSEKFNNRHSYYKYIVKNIPDNRKEYDVAISYAGPTEIIDAYIAYKVVAKRKVSWVHFDISKHFVNKGLYRELYKEVDKVFIVSESAKIKFNEEIKGLEEKTEVLLNIVSKNIINQMAEEKVDFNNFKGVKIVTVGRLSKEKGQDLGIEALVKLKKDGYSVKWYCIGDGTARNEYESLIESYGLEEDFILLGSTANPYPYIKNADIYVQTSRHEGYCITLAEAKCLNKPIITTNFTGAYEQIIDGETGYVVDFNSQELYLKIKKLINNENEMKRFKINLLQVNVDTVSEVKKLYRYID